MSKITLESASPVISYNFYQLGDKSNLLLTECNWYESSNCLVCSFTHSTTWATVNPASFEVCDSLRSEFWEISFNSNLYLTSLYWILVCEANWRTTYCVADLNNHFHFSLTFIGAIIKFSNNISPVPQLFLVGTDCFCEKRENDPHMIFVYLCFSAYLDKWFEFRVCFIKEFNHCQSIPIICWIINVHSQQRTLMSFGREKQVCRYILHHWHWIL